MTSAESSTLTDAAYQRLRHDIVHGQFAPGDKLRVEHLKRAYEVGATPLREALYRLTADGFVSARGQRGFRVAEMSVAELQDLTDLRVAIEGMALTRSVQNGDEDWESAVVAAFHHLTKAERAPGLDIQQWEIRNRDFHLALVSRCDSPWLLRFYETLYDQHKRYRNIARVERGDRRDVHAEHEAIYQAALARDVAALCAANEVHIRETAAITGRIIREYLTPAA